MFRLVQRTPQFADLTIPDQACILAPSIPDLNMEQGPGGTAGFVFGGLFSNLQFCELWFPLYRPVFT